MGCTKRLMTSRLSLLLLIGMAVLSPILYTIVHRNGPARRVIPAPQQLQPQHRLSCDSKLNRTSHTDSPKVLLVAAAPGSGSDWTRLTIMLLTGVEYVPLEDVKQMKNISELYNKVAYYKSHYPYLSINRKVEVHQHQHPDRLVVLLRNPFDAAFSEYTRLTQAWKNGRKRTWKYDKMDLLTVDDYLAVNKSSGKQNIPNEAAAAHFKDFLERWKLFYQYWLDEHKGSFKLYLYQDLVQNNLLFLDMANFFGFGADTNIQKKHQEQCLLQYMEKTLENKRPASALLDNAKMIFKEYFTDECLEAKTYVEMLLKRRFQKDIIIN